METDRTVQVKAIKVRRTLLKGHVFTMAVPSKIPALPLDIVAHIMELCTLSTLTRFAASSVLADELVAKELDIRRTRLLTPFINDQDGFRRKLTQLDSVVSGSAMVALCSARDAFQPADLDVYVPSQKAVLWMQYLSEHEGYHVLARRSHGDTARKYHGGIRLVITMTRETARVDIIESLTVCAIQPILHFWSTAVMIFMTGTGINSLFPQLLEERRGLLSPHRTSHAFLTPPPYDGAIMHTLLAKYASRGFDVRYNHLEWVREMDPTAVCHGLEAPACPRTIRWVGDKHTLTRTFGAVKERMTRPMMEGTLATMTTVWWLGGHSCGLPCSPAGTYVIPQIWVQARDVVE